MKIAPTYFSTIVTAGLSPLHQYLLPNRGGNKKLYIFCTFISIRQIVFRCLMRCGKRRISAFIWRIDFRFGKHTSRTSEKKCQPRRVFEESYSSCFTNIIQNCLHQSDNEIRTQRYRQADKRIDNNVFSTTSLFRHPPQKRQEKLLPQQFLRQKQAQ